VEEQSMADESIDIVCPLCGKTHRYLLSIQRSPFLFAAGSRNNTRQMKRLFTCPKNNEAFESTLEMKEDERGIIAKLNVVGIVEEEENGGKK
jgi:hypothetical protein